MMGNNRGHIGKWSVLTMGAVLSVLVMAQTANCALNNCSVIITPSPANFGALDPSVNTLQSITATVNYTCTTGSGTARFGSYTSAQSFNMTAPGSPTPLPYVVASLTDASTGTPVAPGTTKALGGANPRTWLINVVLQVSNYVNIWSNSVIAPPQYSDPTLTFNFL